MCFKNIIFNFDRGGLLFNKFYHRSGGQKHTWFLTMKDILYIIYESIVTHNTRYSCSSGIRFDNIAGAVVRIRIMTSRITIILYNIIIILCHSKHIFLMNIPMIGGECLGCHCICARVCVCVSLSVLCVNNNSENYPRIIKKYYFVLTIIRRADVGSGFQHFIPV